MACYLTALAMSSPGSATKSFSLTPEGAIRSKSASMAKLFTVSTIPIDSIFDLAEALAELGENGRSFVVRGEPLAHGDDEPRRRLLHDRDGIKATFTSRAARWACLDFDKLICPPQLSPATDPQAAAAYLASLLPEPFQEVSFYFQWSASAGLDGWETLSAHLWFMFDRAVSDPELQAWANTCRAPIDTRLFNAVQPHFIARPTFRGIDDPCPVRNILVRRRRHFVDFDSRTESHDRRRVQDRAQGARHDAKGDRRGARAGWAQSRPGGQEMGGRTYESARPSRRRRQTHAFLVDICPETFEVTFS